MANQNYWREKKWQRKNATAKRTNCGKTHICMKLKVACTPIQMFWASNRGEQSEWSGVCVCSHGYVTLSGSIKFVPYIPGIQSKKNKSCRELNSCLVWCECVSFYFSFFLLLGFSFRLSRYRFHFFLSFQAKTYYCCWCIWWTILCRGSQLSAPEVDQNIEVQTKSIFR